MVLIEVIKLIVNIDRLWDVTVDVYVVRAVSRRGATLVILVDDALDFLTHHVQSDAKCQENQTENAKNDHR